MTPLVFALQTEASLSGHNSGYNPRSVGSVVSAVILGAALLALPCWSVHSTGSVWCVWKGVSLWAHGSPSVQSRCAVASRVVHPGRGQLKVDRIAARRVSAQMVQLRNVFTVTAWNRFNQPRIHQPMDPDRATKESKLPVTVSQRCGPFPAPCRSINPDLGEDPADDGSVEVWNSEKISFSHASASIADVWSGPGSRLQRDPGPSILALLERYT